MEHLPSSEATGRRSLKYTPFFLYLISMLTFLMAYGFPLTDTNFSVIGSRGGRRLLFLLWGALTGNYFYLYTEMLMTQTDCEDRLVRSLLLGALLLFVTAVGIPYLPELLPELARLLPHIFRIVTGAVFASA